LRIERIPIAALLIAPVLGWSGCASTAASAPDGPSLEAVVDAVKEVLVEAESSETPGLPPLKSVSVKLQTSLARSAGGDLRLVVFSAGSDVSKEAVSSVEIELKPPERGSRGTLLPGEVREALARAIVLAKAGAARATRGEPRLALRSVHVDLPFSVSVAGTAGGSVRLDPVGLSASGKISRESVHTVSLVFAP
jgi:hypothetical protein